MLGERSHMGKTKRIPPLFNDMFLRVFGTEESKPATLALANAVLRAAGAPELERVDEISADHTEPGGAVLKSPRLDVVIRCETRLVDIEAQRRAVDIHNKLLFYASKLIVAHTPKGEDPKFERVPEIAIITLLDGTTMFEGEQFLSAGRIHWERDGACIPGKGNPLFAVVEMDKFRRRYNKLTEEVLDDELLSWLYLLVRGYENEKEVDAMSERFDAMVSFAREYGYALDDPKLERDFDRWLESEMEYNSAMHQMRKTALEEGLEEGLKKGRAQGRAQGLEEGRAQGLEEGRAQTTAEIAAKMRELGIDEDIIAQATAG